MPQCGVFPQSYDSVTLDRRDDWDSASVVSEDSQLDSGPSQFSSLGSDARALLAKYLPDTFSRPSAVDSVPSSLFKQRCSQESIPLPEEFKVEFERISVDPFGVFRDVKSQSSAFTFLSEVTRVFFVSKKLSPDLVNVALRLGVNLKTKSYKERDKPLELVSGMTGVSLRLSAYLGSLVSLLARAGELEISADDLLVLHNVLLLISGLLWSSISCTSVVLTSQRRQLALSELGVLERDIPSLCEGISSSGQFLCGGQFTAMLQKEIDRRKQAADLARHFRAHPVPRGRSGPPRRPAPSGSRQRAPFQAPRRAPFQAPRRPTGPARTSFVSQPRSGRGRGSARGGGGPRSSVKPFPQSKRPF